MQTEERVARLMAGTLPAGPRVGRVLVALAKARGLIPNADELARLVGFGSRHGLHRFLISQKLPPLTHLARWVRVITLVVEHQRAGWSLEQLSWRDRVDPSVDSRRVRRVLRTTWRPSVGRDPSELVVQIWTEWTRFLEGDSDAEGAGGSG